MAFSCRRGERGHGIGCHSCPGSCCRSSDSSIRQHPPTWSHSSQPDLITASTPLGARRSSTSNLHDILYHHSLTDNFLSGPTASFSTPSRSHDVTTMRDGSPFAGLSNPAVSTWVQHHRRSKKLNQCPPPASATEAVTTIGARSLL
ncbi:hypothetical protein GE21DRAFT_1346322 [Neurospora crassa]|nr:hypothetical protein GE21DRAFT_1346322 [Neurospora crassa]